MSKTDTRNAESTTEYLEIDGGECEACAGLDDDLECWPCYLARNRDGGERP